MLIGSVLQIYPFDFKPSAPPAGSFILYAKTDDIVYLQDSAGTEYPFASSSIITSLVGDVTGTGPGATTTTVQFVGGQSAANIAAATASYLAATSLNTANTLVFRDSSGNFAAGTITAALNGNATTATSAGSAVNFTGSLLGDVTGTQGATVVAFVGGSSAANIHSAELAANAATPTNTSSTIVKRDASGNFSANTITANLIGNISGSATSFTGSLSGDVTGTQGATVVAFVGGSSAANIHSAELAANAATPFNTASTIVERDASGNFSANNITANLIGNASGSSASFTGSLSGDVTGTQGATVISQIQGTAVAGTTGSGNVVFSNAPTLTGLLSGGSAAFSSTISASNFSGSSSGSNTGDVTTTNTNSINLGFSSGQSGLNAVLNLSTDPADSGNLKATTTIHTGAGAGLHVEYPFGVPVQIGTSNVAGSASSFSLSDHVHAITSSVVLGLLLTGYVTGTNTPITATNSILTAFENLQAQISVTSGSAITALTGDVTATGPGSVPATIAVGAVTDAKASLSNKPAVSVVATTNQTLSGTPTIDGQATTANLSIVLLTAQTTASQNGPWIVQTGAWTRPTWYPSGGTTQSFQFITTLVRLGTTYQGSVWRQTTAAPVIIDTTATAWAVTPLSGNFKSSFAIGPQTGTSEVDLLFKNSFTGTLGWNPTVSYPIILPPTQGAAGTVPSNDGAGNLTWTNPNSNIDGGNPSSTYLISQFVSGGSP